jgi:DnaJ-class molecular chaperone
VTSNMLLCIYHFREAHLMKRRKPKEAGTEIDCPACDGTGFPPVTQPEQPGRKIYPAPCEQCFGKGRIEAPRPQ